MNLVIEAPDQAPQPSVAAIPRVASSPSAAPGTFCSYPNFPEAEKCGKCGVRNPYYKPLEPNSNPLPQTTSAAARDMGTEAEVRVIGPGMGTNP